MGREDQVAHLEQAIASAGPLWRSIDIRIIATRVGDQLHNLLTRVYLDSREPDAVTVFSDLPMTDVLFVTQTVRPFSDLPSLLRGLKAGQDGPTGVCYLGGVAQERDREPYDWYYMYLDGSPRATPYYTHWHAHALVGTGDTISGLLGAAGAHQALLDHELRALEHPFDGLQGLASFFAGDPGRLDTAQSSSVEVFAPLEATFHRLGCALENGILKLEVHSGSEITRAECSIGVFALTGGSLPIRDTIELQTASWVPRGYLFAAEVSHTVADAVSVTAFLRVGGHSSDRIDLVDPSASSTNPRVAAYATVDSDLSYLKEGMRGDDAVGFERSVARLLTFSGLHVDLLSGSKKLNRGADSIAFDSIRRIVYVVECTTSSLDSGGKLGKLVARRKAVEDALPDHRVVGIIASSLDREALSEAELAAARQDTLVVLSAEDLSDLLQLCLSSVNVERTSEFLLARQLSPLPMSLNRR